MLPAAEPQRRLAGAGEATKGTPLAQLRPWLAQGSSGPRRAPQAPSVTPVTAVRACPGGCCPTGQPHSQSLWPPWSTYLLSGQGAPTGLSQGPKPDLMARLSGLGLSASLPYPIRLPSRAQRKRAQGEGRSGKREREGRKQAQLEPSRNHASGQGHSLESTYGEEAQGGQVLPPSWVRVSLSIPCP